MKKMICVFTMMAAFLVFYMGLQTYGEQQYNKIVNLAEAIAEEQDQQVYVVTIETTAQQDALTAIEDFLEENGLSAVVYHMEKANDLQVKDRIFLYTHASMRTFSFFKSKHEKDIDFTKAKGIYYSNKDNDETAYDTLCFIDKKYKRSYQKTLEVHPLSDYLTYAKERPRLQLHIVCDSPKQTQELIKYSKLQTFIEVESEAEDMEESFFPAINQHLSLLLLLLVAISMTLLMHCEIMKYRKEIMICKLHGISDGYIFIKRFLPTFLMYFLIFLATIAACYGAWVGTLHVIQIPLLSYLRTMLLYFGGFLILSAITTYFFIASLTSYIFLKKRVTAVWMARCTLVLKLIVIVLILSPFHLALTQGIQALQTSVFLYQNKDNMASQLSVEGLREGTLPLKRVKSKILGYMQTHHAIYQDFGQNKQNEMLYALYPQITERMDHPFLIVNTEYLKDYPLQTADGKTVDPDSLQDHTLLVPVAYQGEEYSIYAADISDIMYIRMNQQFLDNYPIPYGGTYKVKDPILEVRTQLDEDTDWSSPYLFLQDDAESLAEFQHFLKEEQLECQVILGTSREIYDLVVEKQKDLYTTFLFMLLVYLLLIVVFLFQNVFLYFQENSMLAALQYLVGKSFLQRHGELLAMDIIIYLIGSIIGCVFLQIPLSFLAAFLLGAIGIEALLMYGMTRTFERNNMTTILKGE